MRILLLKDPNVSHKKYESLLKGWDWEMIARPVPSLDWVDSSISQDCLAAICRNLFLEFGNSVDAVQILVSDWHGHKRNRGRHYRTSLSSYEVAVVRYRQGWEDSGRHELMHVFDDIVFTYLKQDLSELFGVSDYDVDVVHGRDPRFEEYKYDEPYKKIFPLLKKAIRRRRKSSQ